MSARLLLFSVITCCTMCVSAETSAGGNAECLIDRVKARSFRIETGFSGGSGFETKQIGKNPNNGRYLRIGFGGGASVRFELGYCFSRRLELDLACLYQGSSLEGGNDPVFSASSISGGFNRPVYLLTPKYLLTVSRRGQFKFGAGIGWYGPGKFTYEIKNQTFIFLIPVPPVPIWQQSTEYVYTYDGNAGCHISAEFEYLLFPRFSAGIGAKYYYSRYKLNSVSCDDEPLAVPDEVRDYLGSMSGAGMDFTFTVSCIL